ncbi:MAG: DUF2817 domain-containing protein [Candidatus Melainabacteria bacterium]|nr:DUF2817 domain-containing protein [Candidatus Melainabacteria bacterium]
MTSKLLIIAGTHGQEPQSCFVARKLVELFKLELKSSEPFDFYQGEVIDIIPDLNRYGLEHSCRGNANGVDLNRNMPTSNWSEDHSHPDYYPGTSPGSEVETQALLNIIKLRHSAKQSFTSNADTKKIETVQSTCFTKNLNDFKAEAHGLIISIHTNHFIANANEPQLNYDGSEKSLALAQKLADELKLPLTRDIGYPTPGSLGSYCLENNIDCMTLELDDNLDNEASWQRYGKALCYPFRVVTP